jgi:hypothetical protein
MKELEHQSLKNLHILGSKMGDCASVAVARLSVDNKNALSMTNNSNNNQKFRLVLITLVNRIFGFFYSCSYSCTLTPHVFLSF